jgi:hypothetical protein
MLRSYNWFIIISRGYSLILPSIKAPLMPLSLKEHISLSREAVEANRAKGNRHSELLAQLYSDPSRFLEEILQNTEDAYARKGIAEGDKILRFCLSRDRIDIYHNGIDFDENDLKAITTFAGTTKITGQGINQIGKFGIGFRSVYLVTERPEIHCHPWHFRIDDYEILEETAPETPAEGFGTLIRLPFKVNAARQLYVNISDGLKALNEYSLLFLEQINILEIWNEKRLIKRIERKNARLGKNIFRTEMIFSEKEPGSVTFLLLKPQFPVNSQAFALGFRLGEDKNGGEIIVPDLSGKLFVYFSTEQETHLRFLLHGHFTNTPTRERVPFDPKITPENITLLHKAAAFLGASLITLRDQGYLIPSIFNVLPISSSGAGTSQNINEPFKDTVRKALQNKKLFPARQGGFATASEMVMTADEFIPDFIDKKALGSLFQRSIWLAEEFINYPELSPYLINEAGIKLISPESLAFRISVTPGFLKSRKREWFMMFYRFLSLHARLWDEAHHNEYYSLRTKEIILLQGGDLSKAFDTEENPLVFLPSGARGRADTVDRRILKNEDSSRFLRMLGIREYHDARRIPPLPGTEEIIQNPQAELQDGKTAWKPAAEPETALEKMVINLFEDKQPGTAVPNKMQTDLLHRLALQATIVTDDDGYKAMKKWCLAFVKLLLERKNAGSCILDGAEISFPGDLVIENGNEKKPVFIACRPQFTINYSMEMQRWTDMIMTRNEAGKTRSMLVLIADAGTASPKVIMIDDPVDALINGKFVFELSGFRMLE